MARIVRKNTLTTQKVKISDAYEQFLSAKSSLCAKKTYMCYRDLGYRHVIPSLTALTDGYMEDLTAVVIRASLDEYEAGHTKGGVFFYYRHLKAFVNWYWDEFDIELPNPMKKVKCRKPNNPPKDGITREEIDKLIKATKSQQFPERDLVMLMILCDTGIRLSSLAGLKIRDIDVAKSQLTVFEKDQDYHKKAFGSTTAKAIRRYLNCLEDATPDDSFWLKMDGTELSVDGLKMTLRRLCRDAQIKLHLFHDFRRFYGLELYKSTHDIYFVSRVLDHKSIEVTKRYLAIKDAEDAEAIRAMSPMDNRGAVTIKRKK